MDTEIDIEKLVNDRTAFNAFVYTPLSVALAEIEKRERDIELSDKLTQILPQNTPDFLKNERSIVLFRQLIAANYETRRFLSLVDAIEGVRPLLWEYTEDKFTSNNEYKHSLGKLLFFMGRGKKGGQIIDRTTVVDFNESNGKKISEVKTVWGESLIDFHRALLHKDYRAIHESSFFDASEWFNSAGKSAANYYSKFLCLFARNNILFENFMLDEKEIFFTKEVFLPAFLEAMKLTGYKPLIVALEPTDIEGDMFWMCLPDTAKDFVNNRMNLVQ